MEERKVKVGGKEKTKVADALVKDYASTLVSKLETKKGIVNYENAVNHCKNLLENIQLREERRQRAAEGRRAQDDDEVD